MNTTKNLNRIRQLCGFALSLTIMLMPLYAMFSSPVSAADDPRSVVSPALYILAEQNSMAMAGIKGNSISFDAEDFARALNLSVSKIESITFTSVPPITDGELRVGSTVLNSGHTVSASNLHLVSYVPNTDISTSSFTFRVGDSPLEMTCKLYMLDGYNYSPTLGVATDASLLVSTNGGTSLYGTLPCHDPEGDEVIIEIVSYPKSGSIRLTDRSKGEYVYTPYKGAADQDSFTYVARDIYGNYSASATVSLTIVD